MFYFFYFTVNDLAETKLVIGKFYSANLAVPAYGAFNMKLIYLLILISLKKY